MSRKKSFAPTLIFGGIVAVLVVVSLFDYKKLKQEKGLGENEQKLLSLTEGEVVEIDIRSKKQNLQLKSEGGNWKLLEPLKDDADDTAIVGLLNAVKEAKVQPIVTEAKSASSVNWAQYGLDPGVEIEIVTDQGKRDAFKVSDTSAYDGSFYVRKNDNLFLGERGLARIADIDIKTLRSHNLWRTVGDIVKVRMRYSYMGQPQNVVLTKDDKGWSVKPTFDLPLSQEKVKDWLQSFRDFRVNDIAASEITPKTLDQFLLKSPSMTVEFKVSQSGQGGHESDVTWKMGQAKDNAVYVSSSMLPDIFKATKFSLRELRIPAEQLLDGNGAMDFPIEKANDIELVADGHKQHFIKGDNDWKKEGAEGSTFKSEQLADFFQKLKGLEPIPADVPPGMNIDAKQNRLTVKGHHEDSVLFEMTWSAVKDQLRWLKISNFKERFKVSAERLNALIKIEPHLERSQETDREETQ